MYKNYREPNPSTVSFVERYIILCLYLGGSTIGGSTVPEGHSQIMHAITKLANNLQLL